MLGIPHRYLTPDLPGIGGSVKEAPEDFAVEEVPLYLPSGAGEHTYFLLEKRGISTPEAVERVARALGRRADEFGLAGLKDRRAVTRQMLSIGRVDPDALESLELPSMRVLWAKRHTNKLRVGHLLGNRFRVVVRGVSSDASARAESILRVLEVSGIPNYFGPQRFGVRGDSQWVGRALLLGDDRRAVRRILGNPSWMEGSPSVVRARWLFEQYRWREALESWPTGYREERKMLRYLIQAGERYSGARRKIGLGALKLYFTSYQSHLFNICLERRLARLGDDLGRLFEGDVAVLYRNGACFPVTELEGLDERSRTFELGPSGPIFGAKMLPAGGEEGRIEESVLSEQGLSLQSFRAIVPRLRLEGGRRPFRVPVADLRWKCEGTDLTLEFFLRKGSYATTFLRELMKNDEVPAGFAEE